jgi:D-arabinose 1-dehydrogenase-like Zn-dependent alcohol dehydrogenase
LKAAIFYGVGQPMEVRDIPVPSVKPNEVLVRISTSGICGGDMQRVNGTLKVKSPIILGHEPAGEVEEVGQNVSGVAKGDLVGVNPFPICGDCYWCARGMENLCVNITKAIGQSVAYDPAGSMTGQGAYADYVLADRSQVFKLPAGVPAVAGSVMTSAGGTIFHAIRKGGVELGDTVAIFGVGDLGSMGIQFLKLMGVRVICVDVLDEKLELARRFGADAVINSSREDPVRKIRELTDGRGADVAFEVIGLRKTMEQAIESVRKGGRIVDVGSVMDPILLNMAPSPGKFEGFSLSKEVTLMTVTHFTRADLAKLLEIAASGWIDFETGTKRIRLDDINGAFEAKKAGKQLRVVVTP